MESQGLRKGNRYEVVVFKGSEVVGSVEHVVVSDNEVATSVFVEEAASLVTLHETLSAAAIAVDFHISKPAIRALVEERIADLKAEVERAEGNDPPTLSNSDIPF